MGAHGVAAGWHDAAGIVGDREKNGSLAGTRQARAADDDGRVGVGDVFERHFEHRRAGELGSRRIADVPHQGLGGCGAGDSRNQCEREGDSGNHVFSLIVLSARAGESDTCTPRFFETVCAITNLDATERWSTPRFRAILLPVP